MELKITVNPYQNENDNILGFANITVDDSFALENVRIRQGSSYKYVELPKYPTARRDENGSPVTKDGKQVYDYKDVFHPISAEVNKALNDAVIKEYTAVIENGKDNNRMGVLKLDDTFEISRVNATPYEKSNLVGLGSVTFGNSFALERVSIKESEKGLYIDLPKYRTIKRDEQGVPILDNNGNNKHEYRDCFHPITAEAYDSLRDAVVNKLNEKRGQAKQSDEQILYAPEGQGRK